MDKKFLSLLSLCQRSGNLLSGEFSCERSLQIEEACLVIVSEDASDNTKKKFVNKSFYYNVPCYVYGDREIMSNVIGKQNRTSLVVIEANFAKQIEDVIKLSI
jgi:ribosomal protein L7Ae-like RNA K-turn-binding protein